MDERKIIAKVGGEKEGYLLEFCADGIYLTVYPKDGTGLMFEVSDIRRVLKDFSVSDYDLMAMTDALRKMTAFLFIWARILLCHRAIPARLLMK